jgi:glyoxylase I family protein
MANEKIKGCAFHHVALKVSDFEKSLKFYTEGLGFEVFRTWKNAQGSNIALIDMGSGEYFEIFADGGQTQHEQPKAGEYFHLALRVDNPREAFERALEYGATPHIEPKEALLPSEPPLPAALAFVKGPDGEQIEFFTLS